jgi:hypothetical protein
MHALLEDSKFPLRRLRRNPGFTAVAVLTLALGTGGTTAIYSVVNGILLKPLPYPHPGRLAQRPRDLRRRLAASHSSGPGRLLHPSTPRDEGRSDGGPAM